MFASVFGLLASGVCPQEYSLRAYYKILPTIGGNSKPLIRINRAFIGVQYDQDDIPSFNTLTFSVEGIDDWVEISGIKVEYPSEKCPAIIGV